MNTPHDPTDDILELTDIVEEGAPGDTGLDFAMDRAVDARSLDEELDDLLRDADASLKAAPPQPQAPPFVRPPQADPVPAAGTQSPQADLSDLDDLFGPLHDDAEPQTTLDMLLDEQSQSQAPVAAVASDDDTIDLDLDVPGLDTDDASPDLLELTDELLADIPDTVLVPPADTLAPEAAEPFTLTAPEGLGLDLDTAEPQLKTPAAPLPEPEPEQTVATVTAESVMVEPAAAESVEPEPAGPAVSQAEFEILSSRLDALEARPEPIAEIGPELILAALPASADDLPLARGLRESILRTVEERLASAAPATGLEELLRKTEDLASRMDAVESRPEPRIDVTSEQVLAALPASADDLPLARGLRESILRTVEERLASAAPATGLEELLRKTEDLASRMDAVESRPEPRIDVTSEQVLAALPASADDLPLARSLRDEILGHVDAKISPMAAADAVDGLRRTVEAMQNQVDAMPDILAKLATAATPALQELENGLSALQTTVQGLEQGMASVRTALDQRDAGLAEMREDQERLREEIEALATRLETAPDATAIKADAEAYIREQVPAVVGRIIREEIQALIKELGA
jgi:predicted RNA-binding Zn ribbon-like protein